MDVDMNTPSAVAGPSSFLPFYGATSTFQAEQDVMVTPDIASFHFRHVAASICLDKGFDGVSAGALAELEKETERYVSRLLQTTLANAQCGPSRRRPTMADALQTIRTEVADADVAETEKVLDDWKKVIGKNVRRNRAGKAKAIPPLEHHMLPRSPPRPKMITLSDDEYDLAHLNIPFRAPAGTDVKSKSALPPPVDSGGNAAGPSTPAGFKLKLKMANRTPAVSAPSPSDPPVGQARTKRKADPDAVKHVPKKKSKEKRKAEREFLETSRVRLPDYGLPVGLKLPPIPARHTFTRTYNTEPTPADTVTEQPVAGEPAATAPKVRSKAGPRAKREPSPPGTAAHVPHAPLFVVVPPPTVKQESTASRSKPTDLPDHTGKLQAQSLDFLQATLRESIDVKPDVAIINYRKIGGLPGGHRGRAKQAKGATHGFKWKIRGLQG